MASYPEFRKSQGVVPFGVGAIIDFENESLMSAGLDMWPIERADGEIRTIILNACQVLDGRLARRLSSELKRKIEFFLSPSEAPERSGFNNQPQLDRSYMPFVRFPNWYFCPRCRVLNYVAWNTQSESASLRCSNMGRRVEGKGEPCGVLQKGRRPHLSPVRFVAACENGHIMDFPWSRWVHHRANSSCDGDSGDLYLYSTPAAGLAGVVASCVKCKASKSMAGAFQRDALRAIFGSGCPGERPWLGPNGTEVCAGQQIPQTIQRGASNAYFAKVSSSILIPPYSARVQQVLDRPDIWAEIESLKSLEQKQLSAFLQTKALNLGLDPIPFENAVRERLGGDSRGDDYTSLSEERYRYDEYKAYTGPRPPKDERQNFDTKVLDPSSFARWFNEFFERVVLVRRLQETRVLTGFSRLVPPEALRGTAASLSMYPRRWLPGISVRGEGIFLQFAREAIDAWQSQPAVRKRIATLQTRLNTLRVERGLERRDVSAELVMVHTFSHLLIRQLAFECGYDSSSIRERVYVSSNKETRMSGLLLYTASGDSEGTLGGLVRQGEPGYLEPTIGSALKNASICSSDPLCLESDGQGTYGLNLAACHACGLLPETSCEEGNLLLDRVLTLGRPGASEIGYFGELLSQL